MPRNARLHSQSNIYHVMLRGINKQQIFYDEDDRDYFLETLKRYKYISGFKLYAYCFMGNHVHLLIGEGKESLSETFKRIGSSFVYRYNLKYERSGHLFQDRFKSEPVESDRYFITVLRYILRNPVAAGLCSSVSEYKYSSAGEYLLGKSGITDTAYANELFGDGLEMYINAQNDDECLDVDSDRSSFKKCTDPDAVRLISKEFGTLTPHVGRIGERRSLGRSFRSLKDAGVSVRQLSRLTGISKSIIERELRLSGQDN